MSEVWQSFSCEEHVDWYLWRCDSNRRFCLRNFPLDPRNDQELLIMNAFDWGKAHDGYLRFKRLHEQIWIFKETRVGWMEITTNRYERRNRFVSYESSSWKQFWSLRMFEWLSNSSSGKDRYGSWRWRKVCCEDGKCVMKQELIISNLSKA